MGVANKRLTPASLVTFLGEVSAEMKNLLESDGFTRPAQNAFVLIMETMKAETQELFGYLPEGERLNIIADCITWMDIGMLIGRSPQWLVDVLLKNKAKLEDKGG